MHEASLTKDKNGEALLIMDMISDFQFEDGDKLFEPALGAAEKIAALKRRAKEAGTDVIYVNDNYGRWNEDFSTFVERTMDSSQMGREIVDKLEPEPGDLFISRVVITGVTTDICVLFTAHDAYMRGFSVMVPSDGTAAVKKEHHQMGLDFMKRVADVEVRAVDEIEFGKEQSAEKKKTSGRGLVDSFSDGNIILAGA